MDIMEKALIVNVICNMIENVVMTVGIVYAAIMFGRFSLLWFLLLPLANSMTIKTGNGKTKNETENEILEDSKR